MWKCLYSWLCSTQLSCCGGKPHGQSDERWKLKAMTLMPLCATGSEALDVSRVASNPLLLQCQNMLDPFSCSCMLKCYALQHNWPNNSDFSTMAVYIWLHFERFEQWRWWEHLSTATETAQGSKIKFVAERKTMWEETAWFDGTRTFQLPN